MKAFFKEWLFLFLVFWSGSAHALTYYISTSNGDDSRSLEQAQNPATPWRSIQHLNAVFDRIQPGDTILFKRGEVFDGGIVISRSGSAQAPIVIGAYGTGELPVINGFVSVTKWTSLGNGIYESPALATGAKVNMVVVNGVNQPMGRYPNTNATNKGYLNFESVGPNSITDQQMTTATDWTGAELVLRSTRYTFERVPVTKHSGGTLTYGNSLMYPLRSGYGYFLQNSLKTLDQVGEWYYNPSTKKVSVFFGSESPASFKVQVSAIDALVNAQGNHIVLENLSLMGANQYGITSTDYNRDGLLVKDCYLRYSGVDGVYLLGRANFTMERCTVLNSNSSAIKPLYNNPNTILRNNYIRDSGVQPGMGYNDDQSYSAIYKGTDGLIAEYNTIINTGYMAIRFAMNNNLIKNNFIDRFCVSLDDGGGIYTFGGRDNPTYYDRKVVGNIILNGVGASEGTAEPGYTYAKGIYIDDNGTNVEIVGNTIAYCSRGINIHNARNITLERNTVYDNSIQMALHHDFLANAITGMDVKNNIFFAKMIDQTVSSLMSEAKDFETFGSFNSNYYARPMYDSLPILLYYKDGNGSQLRQYYELSAWQQEYGKDAGSKKSPIDIPNYSIDMVDGASKFTNSHFDQNANGVFCWSSKNNCNTSWTSTSVLGSGALEATGGNDLRVIARVSPVESSKQYLLRFSGAARAETSVEVYLRRDAPYDVISEKQVVVLDPTKKSFEILFSYPASEQYAEIEFFAGGETIQFWLDDIELFEAKATPTNPDDWIVFAYNPNQRDSTVTLNDYYVDVTNKPYSGQVTLPPYGSIVLIKNPDGTPGENPNPGEDPDPNPDEQPNPDENPTQDPDANPDAGDTGRPDQGSGADQNPNPGGDPDANPDAQTGGDKPEENPVSDPTIPPGTDPDTNPNPIFPGESDPTTAAPADNRVGQQNIPKDKNRRGGGNNSRQSLPEQEELPADRIYPNPVSSWNPELNIEFYTKKKEVNLMILDQTGRPVAILTPDAEPGWNKTIFDTSNLPSGTYYVHRPGSLLNRSRTYPFIVVRD